jgi:hypothetical protein
MDRGRETREGRQGRQEILDFGESDFDFNLKSKILSLSPILISNPQ